MIDGSACQGRSAAESEAPLDMSIRRSKICSAGFASIRALCVTFTLTVAQLFSVSILSNFWGAVQVLEIRQRVGERVIKALLEYQASKLKEEAPVSAVSGKRLHNKGKKKRDRDAIGASELSPDVLL